MGTKMRSDEAASTSIAVPGLTDFSIRYGLQLGWFWETRRMSKGNPLPQGIHCCFAAFRNAVSVFGDNINVITELLVEAKRLIWHIGLRVYIEAPFLGSGSKATPMEPSNLSRFFHDEKVPDKVLGKQRVELLKSLEGPNALARTFYEPKHTTELILPKPLREKHDLQCCFLE